ncbi:hypothetical protein D9758_017195 [Tetrapyrgos nigripes]|uniref:Uncharacterized protein n=1 Tax=Tetrapyrgos nigripes TaxID=182062 RepID=A0A8H5BYY1_9AGAR|nr:hypothetical protein D9758_017195 [Tetrapyrgos nigripes]
MYKSDAKSQYALTDTDLLSLPHESIPPKSFFKYHDVRDLAKRKWEAGAMKVKEGWELPEVRNKGEIHLFKKTDSTIIPNSSTRTKSSPSTQSSPSSSTPSPSKPSSPTRWSDLGFVYIRMIGVHDGSDKTSTSEGTRTRGRGRKGDE